MISDKAITLANSPHMTDGFTEFFCLYLYGVYTIDGATVLEVIDFMIDKTYFMLVFKYSKISVLEGLKYYAIQIGMTHQSPFSIAQC